MKLFSSGVKVFVLIVFALFISLYFMQTTDYFNFDHNSSILTDEAMQSFEKDIKDGKEIDINNYFAVEKNYDNKLSRGGLKLSNFIAKKFNKVVISIFSEISSTIDN